jgi:ribosomal-protein-alanine N-acetyltransferase
MDIDSIRRLWSGTRAEDFVAVPLNLNDTPDLAAIHTQSFLRPWTDGEFANLVQDPMNLCLGLRKNGYAPVRAFIIIRRVINAGEAEVLTIAVDERKQRRGLGYKLLDEAIRRLNVDALESLFLEVGESNRAARRLYDRLGFEIVGERPGYYPANTTDANSDTSAPQRTSALVMRLPLR